MQYALVSPHEATPPGVRIAQTATEKFDVAPPLYWMEVDDSVTAEGWYVDATTGAVVALPVESVNFYSAEHTGATVL
jgi:hypothetical protein